MLAVAACHADNPNDSGAALQRIEHHNKLSIAIKQ